MAVNENKEVRSAEGALSEASRLETVGLILGVVGVTALVFGVVLYAIDPDVLPLALGNGLVGVIGVAVYLATNYRKMVRAVGGRSTPFVILEGMIVVGVVAAAGVANYFAAQSKVEWDLTRDKLFSLHERSRETAKNLKPKVTIYGFFRPGEPVRESLREAVELYQKHTDRIELVFVNPNRPDPKLVERFSLDKGGPQIVIAAESGQYAKVRVPTEQEVTNAIIRVAEKGERKAYFLTGHQEPSIEDGGEGGFARAALNLRNEGFKVETLSLLDKENIPDDTTVLILAGSKRPLFPNEEEAIRVWLDKGGRAVVLLDPGVKHNMEQIWRRYGILVGDDLVVDPNPANKAAGYGPTTPIIQNFEPHAITEKLKGAAMLFFQARSVQPKVGLANLTTSTLIQTGPTSWGETAYAGTTEYARDENDVPGPVPIATASIKVTAAHPEKIKDEARLVVVGDSDLINNKYSQATANGLFFVYAVNWAAGDEYKITIPPQTREGTRLVVTELALSGIVFFSVNLLPLLIIGFGFSVWAVRRRK